MRDPIKGHSALRKGRLSSAGSTYFLTICLNSEQKGLDSAELFDASRQILQDLETKRYLSFIGLVHMPDHLHLLVDLGHEALLSEFIRIYKGRMSPLLRRMSIHWQKGYFDRRLRPTDSIAAVLRYLLMNPYRKGLVLPEESWPYLWCSGEAKGWMSMEDEENTPLPEWLNGKN